MPVVSPRGRTFGRQRLDQDAQQSQRDLAPPERRERPAFTDAAAVEPDEVRLDGLGVLAEDVENVVRVDDGLAVAYLFVGRCLVSVSCISCRTATNTSTTEFASPPLFTKSSH